MRKKQSVVIWLLVLIILLTACVLLYNYFAGRENTLLENQVQAGEHAEKIAAPDFVVYDAEGNAVSFSSFEGKPVVLNFWASWCRYCIEEMPDFERVYEDYGEEVNFLFVNATDGAQETQEKAKEFLAQQEYALPVYYDLEQSAVYAYAVTGLPTTVLIDRDGNVLGAMASRMTEETLRFYVEKMLEA